MVNLIPPVEDIIVALAVIFAALYLVVSWMGKLRKKKITPNSCAGCGCSPEEKSN